VSKTLPPKMSAGDTEPASATIAIPPYPVTLSGVLLHLDQHQSVGCCRGRVVDVTLSRGAAKPHHLHLPCMRRKPKKWKPSCSWITCHAQALSKTCRVYVPASLKSPEPESIITMRPVARSPTMVSSTSCSTPVLSTTRPLSDEPERSSIPMPRRTCQSVLAIAKMKLHSSGAA